MSQVSKMISNDEWTTVQFFVSDTGACEVQGRHNNHRKLRCTCQDFNPITRCKHIKYVRNSIKSNDGVFSIDIIDNGSEELDKLMTGEIDFRELLLRYGKVVYLP